MKIDKKQNKPKQGQGKEQEFKPIKKVPDKTKINVKSAKFWHDIYDDDPEMNEIDIQAR